MRDWRRIQHTFRRDADVAFKLLLGAVIIVLPVINMIGLGYLQLCLVYGAQQRSCLPSWHDWRSLIQEGAEALLIAALYMLLPLFFALLFWSVPFAGVLGTAALFAAAWAAVPLGWAQRKRLGFFSDAFHFQMMYRQLRGRLGRYALVNLACSVCVLAGGALAVCLPFLGIIGGLLVFSSSAALCFYVGTLYGCAEF